MDYTLVIPTLAGLEQVLAKELLALGARNIRPMTRVVRCSGDIGFIYKANFCLRTALRVMVEIADLKIRDESDLIYGLRKIRWEMFVAPAGSFSVRCILSSQIYRDASVPATVIEAVIAQYFMENGWASPLVSSDPSAVQVTAILQGNSCSIQLNSSGESLADRVEEGRSQVSGVMAAGLVLHTTWTGPRPMIDLYCGAGVVIVEAALIAAKIPPGVFRGRYAFEDWPVFDEELFAMIRSRQLDRIADIPVSLFGFCDDSGLSAMAKTNVQAARVEDMVTITDTHYRIFEPPAKGGVVITFLPDAVSPATEMNESDYRELGDVLRSKYSGYTVYLLSGNKNAVQWMRLHSEEQVPIRNGIVECRYLKFEL